MASVSSLGLSVGRFGAAGGLSGAEAFAAVALAADAGVRLIDCPAELQAAERVLGEVLPHAPDFDVSVHTAAVEGDVGAVMARLRASLKRIRRERVAAVLAPARALRTDDGPALWTALLRLREAGKVGAVGIAACVCDDPVGLARRFRPDLMQLPFGLLDRRLLASGALDAIAAAGVEVRLRLLLRARLLFSDAAVAAAPLSPAAIELRRVLADAAIDPLQAELTYALSRPQAAKVVVGVGSPTELRAVLKAAKARSIAVDWDAIDDGTSANAVCSVQPARWRAA